MHTMLQSIYEYGIAFFTIKPVVVVVAWKDIQVRQKQDWGRGFILLLPQAAVLPGSDAGNDVVKPASGFVIQNRQTSCSMWCPTRY